jgi:hypothetical protein
VHTNNSWRDPLLIIIVIASIIGFFFIKPIPQDLTYHNFVDTRNILGIANCFNVISNLPFLFVGIAGQRYVLTHWHGRASWSWLVLFLSVLLVAAGSSYYHLNPSNETLTWDRLPMAIGFMALLAIVLADYVTPKFEKWLFVPLCLLGIFSVLYWHMNDDLRIYAWVQFFSLALLIIVISIYKPSSMQTKYLIFAIVFYVFSKITEYFDVTVFNLTLEMISGHSIKHLLAAISTVFFYLILKHPKT